MIQIDRGIPFPIPVPKILIDKNVPIPPQYSRYGYPWRSMQIGESFVAREGTTSNQIHPLAHHTGRRIGRRFVVRKLPSGYYCVIRVA